MKTILVDFNFRTRLLIILIAAFSPFSTSVKAQSSGNVPNEINSDSLQADDYPGDQSFFYYSDVGIVDSTGTQNLSNAVLVAAKPQDGVFKTYATDQLLYIVNFGGTVYISQDVLSLANYGTYSPQYSSYLTSPSPGRNANLSLFLVPIEMDQAGDHWISIKGIGTIIIEDIDPTVTKSLLVPSGTIFSLQTTSFTQNSDSCGDGGNHAVVIQW